MRTGRLRFLTLALLLPLARSNYAPEDVSPFQPAAAGFLNYAHLAKRQETCPSGYSSCTEFGAQGACCEPNTVCSRDAANNMACCPTGAVCTGVISMPTKTDSSTSSSRTAMATTPRPTQSDFITPSPPGTSTVPSAPFPFIYIPTTFPNQDACLDAYFNCQTQLSSCTASLGGAHGVTIGGASGFGMTVAGSTPTMDVQSVCSSLRDEACYGLQIGWCTAVGGQGGVPSTGGGRVRPSSELYEIVAGLGIALAGMVA